MDVFYQRSSTGSGHFQLLGSFFFFVFLLTFLCKNLFKNNDTELHKFDSVKK